MLVKGIFLDLDGTLIDSLDLHVWSLQETLKRFGIYVERKEIVDRFGMSIFKILDNLKEKHPEIKNIDEKEILKLKRDITKD